MACRSTTIADNNARLVWIDNRVEGVKRAHHAPRVVAQSYALQDRGAMNPRRTGIPADVRATNPGTVWTAKEAPITAKKPPSPPSLTVSLALMGFCALCTHLNTRRGFVASGTVKWFNATKGYGFVQPDDGGKDVFLHISAVEKAGLSSVNEGTKISYEEVANKGKTSAENIRVS
jgi:CspA family cold shock protein